MGANYLIVGIGLIICFGGIYFRRICAGIMGFVWGVLGTILIMLLIALSGDLDIDESSAIFGIVVGGLLFAALSAIYYKVCALINGFSFGFTGLLLILLLTDNLDSLESVIILALLAGIALAFLSFKFYDHSFMLLTAFTGAFIASLGVYAIMHKETFDEILFEVMWWGGIDGLSIVWGGTFILGCIGVFVQYQRLSSILGEHSSSDTTSRDFNSVLGTVSGGSGGNEGGKAPDWKPSVGTDANTTSGPVSSNSIRTLSLVSNSEKDKFLIAAPIIAYFLFPLLSRLIFSNYYTDYYEPNALLTIYNYLSLAANYVAVGCIAYVTIAKTKQFALIYMIPYAASILLFELSYLRYYGFLELILYVGKYLILWGLLVLVNMAIKKTALKPLVLAALVVLYENYLYYWIGARYIYFYFNRYVVVSGAAIIAIVWYLFKSRLDFNIFALSTPNETYVPSSDT